MSDKLIIDSTTQEVLRSYMKINNSMVFHDSETNVRAVDGMKLATYKNFKMPQQFALASVNKLLSSLKMCETEEIEICDNYILIESNVNKRESIKLYFGDEFHLETIKPGFEAIIPPHSIEFKLSKEDIRKLLKAATSLELSSVIFSFSGNKMTMVVCQVKDRDRDKFKIERELDYEVAEDFEIILESSDFIFIQGDYIVRAGVEGYITFTYDNSNNDNEPIDLMYVMTSGIGE